MDIPQPYGVPLGSWTHDPSGLAIIKTKLGEELWANARELADLKDAAAKAYSAVDKQIRVILAGGPALHTRDGRTIATLDTTHTRNLDKKALAAASGLDIDSFYVPGTDRTTIVIAPRLEPRQR